MKCFYEEDEEDKFREGEINSLSRNELCLDSRDEKGLVKHETVIHQPHFVFVPEGLIVYGYQDIVGGLEILCVRGETATRVMFSPKPGLLKCWYQRGGIWFGGEILSLKEDEKKSLPPRVQFQSKGENTDEVTLCDPQFSFLDSFLLVRGYEKTMGENAYNLVSLQVVFSPPTAKEKG